MKHTDGKQYTIGEITDNTVEVICWDDNYRPEWKEVVEWQPSDTTGDAIRRAIQQREGNNTD